MIGRSNGTLTEYQSHRHNCWEILYHLSGDCTMFIDEQHYEIHPGDIAILPPRLTHAKIAPNGFTDLSLLVKEMIPFGDATAKIIHDDEDASVLALLEIAERYYQETSPNEHNRSTVIVNSISEAIYQLLAKFYITEKTLDSRIDRIIDTMQKNLSNSEFSLADEIEHLGYSKGYFRVLFKDFIGEPPAKHFNRMRIEYAKTVFSTYGKGRPIKEVAMDCGFTDPFYFSRVFKKFTGVSPEYFIDHIHEYNLSLVGEKPD